MSAKYTRDHGKIPIIPKGRHNTERTEVAPVANPHGSVKPMGSIFDHVPRQKLLVASDSELDREMVERTVETLTQSIPANVRKEALIPVGGNFPNKFAVGIHGDWIVVMGQAQGMHTKADALNLAAYLVAMGGGLYEFLPVLKGIEEA